MAAYGATLLRLILGVVYIMHAYLALVVFGPSGMMAYQVKSGIPFPEIATWYLIVAHGLGGIFLVLGIFARWAALANVPVMLGAISCPPEAVLAHQNGYEYVSCCSSSLAVAMIGGAPSRRQR
jgi:putative oxidoreductase